MVKKWGKRLAQYTNRVEESEVCHDSVQHRALRALRIQDVGFWFQGLPGIQRQTIKKILQHTMKDKIL